MKIDNNAGIGKLSHAAGQDPIEQTRTNKESSSEKRGDSVQLSNLARHINEARAIADQLPEVRADRIALARQRLDSGFYDSAEARDDLSVRLAAIARPTR